MPILESNIHLTSAIYYNHIDMELVKNLRLLEIIWRIYKSVRKFIP